LPFPFISTPPAFFFMFFFLTPYTPKFVSHGAFVDVLINGATDQCVSLKNDMLTTIPLGVAIQPKDINIDSYYKLIKILT